MRSLIHVGGALACVSDAFDLSFFGFHEQMLGTPRMFGIDVTYRR